MGKDQRTIKHQHQIQNRSKFKGETSEQKSIPQIDDDLIEIGSGECISKKTLDMIDKSAKNLAKGNVGKPIDMNFVHKLAKEFEEDEKLSKEKEETEVKPAVRKVSKKKTKCKKCTQARKQTSKAQTFASKRKGVRLKKDSADKLIDDVLKM